MRNIKNGVLIHNEGCVMKEIPKAHTISIQEQLQQLAQ
jgi:hypothetical protein